MEVTPAAKASKSPRPKARGSDWNKNFELKKAPKVWQAAQASGSDRGAGARSEFDPGGVARRQGSPYTGKCSARPAGKPGDSRIVKGAFATFPSSPLDSRSYQRTTTTEAPQYAFLRHGGIFHTDVASNQNQTRAGIDRLPPVGPDPGGRTRREDRALLIVCDEFRPAIP